MLLQVNIENLMKKIMW